MMRAAGPTGTPGRIPTLDGWRGIAVLLVVIGHSLNGLGITHGRLFTGAGHGVAIFFVLSGYLITRRLMNENIDHLPRFYVRRAFRLWPVVWFYLAAFLLIGAVSHSMIVSRRDLAACLLFSRNYFPGNGRVTGHFWTLSIEEQFYLFWPALLALMPRRFALLCTATLAGGFAFYRVLHWDQTLFARIATPANLDTLLVGCSLALALGYPQVVRAFADYGRLLFWIGAALLAAGFYYEILIPGLEAGGIALLLGATSVRGNPVLDWAPLRWVGLMSYSLYVWQEPFIASSWDSPLFARMIGLGVATVLSFFLIEKPMIRLERKIEAAFDALRTEKPVDLQELEA